MYFVYILQSQKDGRSYVGYSSNLKRRIAEHNAGKSISTKNRRPFKLLKYEIFETEAEAKKERWWKSGAGRNEIKKMF